MPKITRTKTGKCPTCKQSVQIEEQGFKIIGIEIYFPFWSKIKCKRRSFGSGEEIK